MSVVVLQTEQQQILPLQNMTSPGLQVIGLKPNLVVPGYYLLASKIIPEQLVAQMEYLLQDHPDHSVLDPVMP